MESASVANFDQARERLNSMLEEGSDLLPIGVSHTRENEMGVSLGGLTVDQAIEVTKFIDDGINTLGEDAVNKADAFREDNGYDWEAEKKKAVDKFMKDREEFFSQLINAVVDSIDEDEDEDE